LIAQNAQHIAGGINSNFRIGMAGGPLVFERGEGPYLFDVDGNKLIDYYCGMGAMILGHSPAGVQQAVKDQVDKGILYAGQSPVEFEAAKILCERIPSAQRIRFGSSGSEVAQAAFRDRQAHHPEIRRPLSWLVRQYPVVHRAGAKCGRTGRRAGAGAGQRRTRPYRCRGPGCDRLE
jgi:4-aminobutyrate aminotransferase-like enzyme